MKKFPNRYPGKCHACGVNVPREHGFTFKPPGARKYVVECLDCPNTTAVAAPYKPNRVTEFYFPATGNYAYQNSSGRCEDAPCCGCCTC